MRKLVITLRWQLFYLFGRNETVNKADYHSISFQDSYDYLIILPIKSPILPIKSLVVLLVWLCRRGNRRVDHSALIFLYLKLPNLSSNGKSMEEKRKKLGFFFFFFFFLGAEKVSQILHTRIRSEWSKIFTYVLNETEDRSHPFLELRHLRVCYKMSQVLYKI